MSGEQVEDGEPQSSEEAGRGTYQIPFEYTTAIKVRVSGLTRGSAGNGRARDTVNHLFVKEAFSEGRLSRDADTYLCDPNATPRFPSGEGEHDEPREVTCNACLDLMERWEVEPERAAWCMSCGETAEANDRDPERFAETHTESDCPADNPVVQFEVSDDGE